MRGFAPPTLLALALAAGAALAQPYTIQAGKAIFIDADGKQVGSAVLSQTPHGVLIGVEIRGLSPGEHAFHIHERGTCLPGDGFESAGGHYAPLGRAHGYLVQEGAHAGDMPNQYVGADGVMRAQVLNAGVTLERGRKTSLFDADGSALVVHEGADDYRSQPAGNAGKRVACGVITAVNPPPTGR